jgi:hypothetical protein
VSRVAEYHHQAAFTSCEGQRGSREPSRGYQPFAGYIADNIGTVALAKSGPNTLVLTGPNIAFFGKIVSELTVIVRLESQSYNCRKIAAKLLANRFPSHSGEAAICSRRPERSAASRERSPAKLTARSS